MNNSFKLALASGVSAVVAFTGPSAYAAAFGPAVANVGLNSTVSITTGAGTDSITLPTKDYIFATGSGGSSGTGTLGSGNGVPYDISNTSLTSGKITFSTTQGATVGDSVSHMFSFKDGHGGTFEFDLSSVSTVQYNYNPGVSAAITLYLLGTMYDTNPSFNYTPTATSITFQINSTGSNTNYSPSLSLANPPSPNPVPEPAALSLLGTGLVGLGALRRRRR